MKKFKLPLIIAFLSFIIINTTNAKNSDYPTISIQLEIVDKNTGKNINNVKCRIVILNETEHCLHETVEPSTPFYDTLNFENLNYEVTLTRRFFPKNYTITVDHENYFKVVKTDSFVCNSLIKAKIELIKTPELKNCEEGLVKKMGDGYTVSSSRIRYGLSNSVGIDIDSQYVRYEQLRDCATISELEILLNSENNIVLSFAWNAYAHKAPTKALDYLFKNEGILRKKEVNKFISHCQGTYDMKVIDFMIEQFYSALLLEEVKVPSDKIVQLLKIKELRVAERHKEMNNIHLKDF